MPRPGFVLDVDRSTPPILFHHGESLRLEKLPAGRSRVLYPGEFSENFASGLTRLPGRGRTRSKIRAASGFAIG